MNPATDVSKSISVTIDLQPPQEGSKSPLDKKVEETKSQHTLHHQLSPHEDKNFQATKLKHQAAETAFKMIPKVASMPQRTLDQLDEKSSASVNPLWNRVIQNSESFIKQLNLSEADIDLIEDFIQTPNTGSKHLGHLENGFLNLEVEGKQFSLFVHTTAGFRYGGSWVKTLQIGCLNDPLLNSSLGKTTAFINAVSQKWHAKILANMNADIVLSLREKIDKISSTNHQIWTQMLKNSQELIDQLNLPHNDLDFYLYVVQKDSRDFLKFNIEGKEFTLILKDTCGVHYGSSWIKTIQTVCNDETLNNATGKGTTKITHIPEKWHQKIVNQLTEEVRLFLINEIDQVKTSNGKIWAQVSKHSQDLIKHLNLSKRELEVVERHIQGFTDPKSFLDIEVDGKQFSLYSHNTCAFPYGGSWINTLQIDCVNDQTLNTHTGGGTTFINAIPKEWHEKILNALNEETKSSIRERIDSQLEIEARKARIHS